MINKKSVKFNVNWSIKDVILIFIAQYTFIFLMAILGVLFKFEEIKKNLYITNFLSNMLVLFIISILLRKRNESWKRLGLIKKNTGRLIILGCLFGFFCFVLGEIIFFPEHLKEVINKINNFKISSLFFILVFFKGFNSILLGPFVEELLERGLFYQALLKRLNRYFSITIVSILSTILHLGYITSYRKLAVIFSASFIATYLFDKYRNLFVSIAFHSTINYFVWLCWTLTG